MIGCLRAVQKAAIGLAKRGLVKGCLRAAQKAAIGCKEGLVIGWLRAWGEPPWRATPASSLCSIKSYNFRAIGCGKGLR